MNRTARDYSIRVAYENLRLRSTILPFLKEAKNLPPKVEKYVKQIKKDNPDYDEGQAWATAWSIYCKHVNNDSPHCKKKPGEYFDKKADSDGSYMSVQSLSAIEEHAREMLGKIDRESDLPDWVESKITQAHQIVLDVYEYMAHGSRD